VGNSLLGLGQVEGIVVGSEFGEFESNLAQVEAPGLLIVQIHAWNDRVPLVFGTGPHSGKNGSHIRVESALVKVVDFAHSEHDVRLVVESIGQGFTSEDKPRRPEVPICMGTIGIDVHDGAYDQVHG
jgi:hypothetical protein